jgi:hypothetical protein
MVEPPYWLTNKGVDEINAKEYDVLRTELMTVLADEEAKLPSPMSCPVHHALESTYADTKR